jgi:hypothetical protein
VEGSADSMIVLAFQIANDVTVSTGGLILGSAALLGAGFASGHGWGAAAPHRDVPMHLIQGLYGAAAGVVVGLVVCGLLAGLHALF